MQGSLRPSRCCPGGVLVSGTAPPRLHCALALRSGRSRDYTAVPCWLRHPRGRRSTHRTASCGGRSCCAGVSRTSSGRLAFARTGCRGGSRRRQSQRPAHRQASAHAGARLRGSALSHGARKRPPVTRHPVDFAHRPRPLCSSGGPARHHRACARAHVGCLAQLSGQVMVHRSSTRGCGRALVAGPIAKSACHPLRRQAAVNRCRPRNRPLERAARPSFC